MQGSPHRCLRDLEQLSPPTYGLGYRRVLLDPLLHVGPLQEEAQPAERVTQVKLLTPDESLDEVSASELVSAQRPCIPDPRGRVDVFGERGLSRNCGEASDSGDQDLSSAEGSDLVASPLVTWTAGIDLELKGAL
jgi:hypothetical protein